MSDVTIKYKGQSIATMDASGTKTLGTQGKYCEGDIGVEYVKPAGPSGTKQISITSNGTTTEDVAAYANVEITVDVQGGGGEWTTNGIAWGTEPSGDIIIDFEPISEKFLIAPYAFYQRRGITSVTGYQRQWNYSNPIQSYAFAECTALRSISFPNLDKFQNNSHGSQFRKCSSLVSIDLPQLQMIMQDMFRECSALPIVVLPSTDTINSSGFQGCTSLASFDFKGGTINANAFYGDTALNTIIIRKSDGVSTLANINAFTNTPFASGGTGGTLYVPSALISSYQSATNWSTILGYANNSIQAIEGSQYENAYADGAPIT